VHWMAMQNNGFRFQWQAWELHRSWMIDEERWKTIASLPSRSVLILGCRGTRLGRGRRRPALRFPETIEGASTLLSESGP